MRTQFLKTLVRGSRQADCASDAGGRCPRHHAGGKAREAKTRTDGFEKSHDFSRCVR